MMIAQNRKACMELVLPEQPTPSEQYAADELQYYLELMTGAPFRQIRKIEGPALALGRAAEQLGVSDDGLGDEGFLLKTVGENLAILGGERGVLYGVYEPLEQLGCRFFTATCEQVPVRVNLPLPQIDDRQLPAFEYREHNYYESETYTRFAPKLRLNGARKVRNPRKTGGFMAYARFVHTLGELVPVSLYGESHPEYYSMRPDGSRSLQGGQNQLCLTNPDVLEIAVESTRRILRENPDARIMSISQNDWPESCQCPSCLAVDREEQSPAGTLLRFVNALAERLEEEFPRVIFDTLAYQYTRPVPRLTRPRHNVCVRLCSIECCFSHPFEECEQDRSVLRPDGSRSSFIQDLRDWGQVCNRVYIWDYTTSFSHYAAPHPNWRALQPNMQAFARNHVKGVFEQANGAARGGCDLNELRAYLIGKLLWNPDTDVSRHIREFTDYYYGPAGEEIRAYMDALCDKAERERIHIGYNDPCNSPLFDALMLDQLDAILRRAEEKVAGDPLRLQRVAKVHLSVRYLRIKNRSMATGETDPEEINRFFTDWKAHGLTRMEEWVSPQTSHKALLRRMWRGVEFYDHWAEEGGEEL
ncbi:MAG: DUF4838 domain-containing protein [Oscillospiraceae bacterium]|nr:DUF4838 domain-containing protein [Oscillospiraceae bacterium]